jgi:hypothetical protein
MEPNARTGRNVFANMNNPKDKKPSVQHDPQSNVAAKPRVRLRTGLRAGTSDDWLAPVV